MDSLPYISHIISNEGVKPDPNKITAIQSMPAPTDSDGVRWFLGHGNYLAKFIPHCSAECEPLRRLIGLTGEDFD